MENNKTSTEQLTHITEGFYITEGFSESDVKKINTLMSLHIELNSLQTIEEKDKKLQVAQNIENLLQGYSSEEISQFAQCISGKRSTLPGTDIVFMIQNPKSTSENSQKKIKP